MEEDESLRVALKKAHEIRTRLDEFIVHLSEIHKKHYESRSPILEPAAKEESKEDEERD